MVSVMAIAAIRILIGRPFPNLKRAPLRASFDPCAGPHAAAKMLATKMLATKMLATKMLATKTLSKH
jgi:hypothetical protein